MFWTNINVQLKYFTVPVCTVQLSVLPGTSIIAISMLLYTIRQKQDSLYANNYIADTFQTPSAQKMRTLYKAVEMRMIGLSWALGLTQAYIVGISSNDLGPTVCPSILNKILV